MTVSPICALQINQKRRSYSDSNCHKNQPLICNMFAKLFKKKLRFYFDLFKMLTGLAKKKC